jgi:3-methyladenine DNA glycosylase AlkC
MGTKYSITDLFGGNLAEILSGRILQVYPEFDSKSFISGVVVRVNNKTYTHRIGIIAEQLKLFLPSDYETSIKILISILGDENPNETGMFTNYYWILPIGKFVSNYGLNHFETSIQAIEEITKRNTGEYAVRPFIQQYPEETLIIMHKWAQSPNFHLRRLASEGLRPKLPWAPKLETFIQNPQPVFDILEVLKEDEILFVKKSVANHLTDWLKVNLQATSLFLEEWHQSDNIHTQWILNRATRKIKPGQVNGASYFAQEKSGSPPE